MRGESFDFRHVQVEEVEEENERLRKRALDVQDEAYTIKCSHNLTKLCHVKVRWWREEVRCGREESVFILSGRFFDGLLRSQELLTVNEETEILQAQAVQLEDAPTPLLTSHAYVPPSVARFL